MLSSTSRLWVAKKTQGEDLIAVRLRFYCCFKYFACCSSDGQGCWRTGRVSHKNLRECLNPSLGSVCTSPGQLCHSPSWVFTSAECLAQQAASPAQLCNYRDHSTRLASHRSLPCVHGPASGENGIISALLQSPLNSLGNSWVQWPQTRCSSTLNQMFLPPPAWGSWQQDHAAVLDVVPVAASQANLQSLMIHLQGGGFLFPALRMGQFEFWFVSL